MEQRKQKERALHNLLRDQALKEHQDDFEYLTSNSKWYSAVRKSRIFTQNWLFDKCQNKKVLDYCCGNGEMSFKISEMGATEIAGIDISEISIENARKNSAKKEKSRQIKFSVMDAENMTFNNDTFDIVYESGVLHHLDLPKAYPEIARVLKPNGKCICIEALGHNPVIQYYREKTPHLRTEWETKHILRKKEIELAKKYFNSVKILGFFHLSTILAVPFRRMAGFNAILSVLEGLDTILLKLPILKWQAWQVVFELSEPKTKS